jgi:hypothetical protein
VDNLNKKKIDDELVKIKNKCKGINEQFEKCKVIHDRLYKVFYNKQKLYLDSFRKEIREKKHQKKL